ncbi:MAG TPA: hypothetical protein VK195_10945 [Burkholderiaceae bacterium]|nr:hypothetical protein [Burkholderiaceae bacterium]
MNQPPAGLRPMRLSVLRLALKLAPNLTLCAALLPAGALAANPPGFELSFHPVGSPAFDGPPRIGEPGFVPPVALSVHAPQDARCLARKPAGEYEALIEADGTVAGVHSHHVPVEGDACEKTRLFPSIRKWRFAPATWQGKPIPVYLWIGIEGTVEPPKPRR